MILVQVSVSEVLDQGMRYSCLACPASGGCIQLKWEKLISALHVNEGKGLTQEQIPLSNAVRRCGGTLGVPGLRVFMSLDD
jgi:hypothetical protein